MICSALLVNVAGFSVLLRAECAAEHGDQYACASLSRTLSSRTPPAAAGLAATSTPLMDFGSRPGDPRKVWTRSGNASTPAPAATARSRRASTPKQAGCSAASCRFASYRHLIRNRRRSRQQGSHRCLPGRRVVEEPRQGRSERSGCRLLPCRQHRITRSRRRPVDTRLSAGPADHRDHHLTRDCGNHTARAG